MNISESLKLKFEVKDIFRDAQIEGKGTFRSVPGLPEQPPVRSSEARRAGQAVQVTR